MLPDIDRQAAPGLRQAEDGDLQIDIPLRASHKNETSLVDVGGESSEVVFEVAELNIEIVAAFFEGNEPKNVQTMIGIFKGKTIFEVRRLFLGAFRQSSDRR